MPFGMHWCLKSEVFDSLLARELDESLAEFDDELSAEEEREMMSNPGTDPGFAVGRMAARDFCPNRVLDRLLTYERQVEGSLRRTMADLGNMVAQCQSPIDSWMAAGRSV